jgi:CspA family cold shock protein
LSTSGTVVAFDEHTGYGTVRAGDGDGERQYFFHCTQIADGSRTIPIGADVTFDVVAGRLGHWEAVRVATRPAPGS